MTLKFLESVDCAKKFEVLQQNIQRLTEENEIILAIENTITLLSAELSLLWNQFLDLFRSQQTIAAHLAKEHHLTRVTFFNLLLQCCAFINLCFIRCDGLLKASFQLKVRWSDC